MKQKIKLTPILLTAFFICSHAAATHAAQPNGQTEKHRILISTDIGGTDPDDNQSMAHFLMYCNEFETEDYLNGRPKLGDTPSLLYMMRGNPADVGKESWGGSFEPCGHSARVVFNRPATANDTVQVYAVMEFRVKGPIRNDISIGSPCITLTIANQSWDGFYLGNGDYVARHSTYKTGTQAYSIVSDIPGFPNQKGEITIEKTWPGRRRDTDYMVGRQWFTDKSAPDLFWKGLQGAMTVFKWRHEAMDDWGKRWGWLK